MKRQIIIPSFAVSPPLITTAPVLPSVNQGLAYSQQLTAVGGYPPYNWTVVSDSGSGLTLNATSGVLSGNANVAGTFTIVIKVTDYRLFPSAPVSFSLTVNPTGSNLTIYHGLAIAVTLPGTGSKDHAGTIVFDQGFAPLTVVDPQWASAGGSLGFISGGAFTGADAQYNPGNVAYGMQTSGSTIAAPHIYSQACAKGTLAYNPPGSSAGEPTFTAQIGHSNKTFPKHTFISFKYRVDPLFVFGLGSPNNDNNWKFITYTDGATTCFTNAGGSNIAQYYYCGSGSGQGAFSGPAGVGWQCAFDEAFPAMNPTNLAIAPDNNGHSIEWPFGSADSGDPQYMTRYASQYNPVNPSNGFVITEYRIRWMTDTTGYVQARSSTIGLAFPPKLCINYQQQTAEPSGNGNTAVWNEGWICTYTRNYGTVGSPQYNNAIYVADHMYDQDGSNTYQAYLHDQPTLAASTWWEPQKYTDWINSVPQVVCNVATVPLGTAYITAVNDVGTESGAQKVTVVAQPAAPVITTASLPSATVGSAYSFDATSTGGVTPITWSATGLPAGLSIAPSNGLITGTPTTAGTDSVTLAVQDGLNRWVYKTLPLTVNTVGTLDGYPLLGMISNGGTQNEDQGTATSGVTWVQMAGRRHWSMPGWPPSGWVGPSGGTPTSICNAVLAANVMAVPARVCNYYIIQTQYAGGSQPSSLTSYVTSAKWWLYNAANSGGSIVTQGNGNVYNVTAAAPTFSGQTLAQYFAQWVTGVNFYGTVLSNAANPNMAGLFMDNYAGVAIATGFWNLTSSQAPGEPDPNQDVRTGQAAIVSAIRAAAPAGYFQSGNVADAINNNSANLTGLTNTLDFALMESQSGQSYSLDNLGWTAWVLPSVARARSMCTGRANSGVIWHADGISVSTGQDYASSARGDPNWQGVRYTMGASLVTGCYFCPTPSGNYNSNTQFNLDIMNKGKGLASTAGYEYLGQPLTSALGAVATSTPWMTISGAPIWRRDFTNGIVLVRPAQANTPTVNTTSVTVTAAMLSNVTYNLFTSTQDATYNGGTVTSWTFPRDRDSIILLNAPA